jgi:GNAT superfamily N-acetyltransferase
VRLPLPDGDAVSLRTAAREDVPTLVRLLAADQLGATRDGATTDVELAPYLRAFDAITADPAHELVVVEHDGRLIGTLQLSVLPGLARRGALRAQLEPVRVEEAWRGRGVGGAMVGWAIEEARSRGCALVQLTSDRRRADAHRFYARLGFEASHEGFKLAL